MNPKLTTERLSRRAIVYIRQSSPGQVLHNQESQRRQFGLVDRARELGFQNIVVIDDDLGRSNVRTDRGSQAFEVLPVSEPNAGFAVGISDTQIDLQREFHLAQQNVSQVHRIPNLSLPPDDSLDTADPCGIGRALATTRHLLEMFRRQLTDEKTRRRLHRLDQRLLKVASQLQNLSEPET